MLNPSKLDSAYRKICALALMLMCFCLLLSATVARAQGGGGFDHAATAFPLMGSHEQVRCEACHIKGIFKSTPKACASCHVVGNQRDAVAMSAKHIPITLACDACHNVSSFSAVQFNHSMVQPGFCAVCHDGTRAKGLSANHIPTSGLSCDQCHSSSSFIPVRQFPHAILNGDLTNCATCHDGRIAKGMAVNHLPRSNPAQCGSCHINSTLTGFTSFAGGQVDHGGLTSACADCHGPSITGASFAGISSIVVMPATSPAGPSSHIPSSTACESCHLGSLPVGLMAANSSHMAPGSGFATPAPSNAQIHAGVTSGCSSCHEANFVWMGVSAYPISPGSLVPKAQYMGFQTRPLTGAGSYSVADAAHPSSGDCSQCHAGTNYFSGDGTKPANHIPTSTSALCSACHTTPGDYTTMPTLASIHANAPSTTSNCAQCHGSAAASFAIPSAGFTIVGIPSNHVPTGAACESCHVGAGSSIAATPVGNGAKFSGSLMSHAGITSNCAACHGPGITGSSFAGVSQMVVMPATSPMGASSHIPSSTTCESCHLGSTPAGMVAASSTKTAPGTLFATPVPTTAQIHSGVTGGCSSCHDTSMVWMGMNAYPIAPTVLTTGAQYTGFHSRPVAAASTYSVADAAHPSAGDCSQCHTGTNYFSSTVVPANHIPTLSTAQCTACHTSTDYSVMPTLANIHANAPSTTTNCAQCHGSSAASFAIPAANFSIVGFPGNHVPTSAACESCHVGAGSSIAATPVGNGAKFSGSLMSHAGITNNCAACHGPGITGTSFVGVSKIVAMPATSPMGASSHIPSSTTCESCHLGSTPAGMVAASATKTAPGTLFATPVPTTAQIHSGITGSCASCHDTSMVWMGMNAYPIAPTVLTTGAQYTGFHSRPVAAASTYSVADAAHPSAGDCSQCHTGTNYFSSTVVPANHIPTLSTAQCTACHTSTDYSVMPTLANIHANAPSTTTNCAQCHGSSAASFAIPAANFSIVGFPGNHVPTSAACESCHVGAGSSIAATPVGNGAKFSGSLMSHAGITSNCAACHGPGITGTSFVGVSKIVVMPATSPMGASAHIPSSTTCETCHLGTTPAGMVAASATKTAPGTLFATPAPTTTMIHTGITSGCSSCHDTSYVWMGMSSYPIAPTVLTSGAQYTGFHSRPVTAASTYSIADAAHPSTGDCSVCHSGTAYFTGIAKPTGHMPTTLACATCHIVAGDYSVAGLAGNTILHTGISTGCISCHTAGASAGPFAGCTTQATCASPPPVTYQPKLMPLLAGGSATAPSASTHVPAVGIACELCHSATVFTSFAGMNMKSNTPAHNAVGTATCESCHEYPYVWYGVTIKTTGSTSHHGRKAGQDCTACHSKSYGSFNAARVRPVMRGAANTLNQRFMPGGGLASTLLQEEGVVFSHAGVAPGQCQTCHNAQVAQGIPPVHLQTRMSCDSCHRTTAWKPAQFSHQGVLPGQCQVCHNSAAATGKPAGHFVSARSCDACHRTVSWLPVSYPHISPLYQPQPGNPGCVSCHVTNGELIPRQMRGNNRPKPVPVHTVP